MTFTVESRALRRALGPLAWCALEVLVERVEPGDARVVDASVRSVAAELGVAKNTAHRALAALARAGLATPLSERDATGRFTAGRYRLHVDHLTSSATTAPALTPPRHRPTPKPSPRATTSTTAPAQLSLLDPA